ncbi:MAG: hypothetical protein Q9221_009041 [Calogaya cf. arnoldii]
MASRMILFAYVLTSLLVVGRAGFETLDKPFNGAQEVAWESLASKGQEANERRRKSEASASSTIRMVTRMEGYTLTSGESENHLLNEGETVKSLSLTGPTTFITTIKHALRPGRPWGAYYPDDHRYCCMNCYVYFPEVEVFYWPVPESEASCANGSKPTVTSQAVLPTGAAKTAEARYNALFGNSSITDVVSIVNDNGFTFVSPSIYVAFGDVSAGDACGAIGLGKDHYVTTLGTRAFDPANVLCPLDYEPETLFVQQDSLAGISTYRPRIEIPQALQDLDPAWKRCVVDSYEGIDPPHALSNSQLLAPPLPKETGNGEGGEPGKPPGNPQANPPAPITNSPPNEGSSDPPKQQDPQQPNAQDPGKLDQSGRNPTQDVPNGDARPGPANQQAPQQPDAPGSEISNQNGIGGKPVEDDRKGPSEPSKTTSPPTSPADISTQQPNPQPAQPAQPSIVVEGQTIKQGAAPVTIGGIPVIYSKGSVYVGEASAPAPTAGGFNFVPVVQQKMPENAAKPAQAKPAVIVQGQTIKQGSPPVIINGNKVTYTGGVIQVGNEIVPITPPKLNEPPKPVVVQGMTFIPTVVAPKADSEGPDDKQTIPNSNPSRQPPRPAIIIKGQTISENGPPATINGKPIVYSGGAVFAVGTKVVVPTVLPGQPPAKPINVAGMSFTPLAIASPEQSSRYNNDGDAPAVMAAGHTLTQNAPAIIINGATLAYSSGSVYVNGKAAPAPTTPPLAQLPTTHQAAADKPIVVGGLTVYAAPPTPPQEKSQEPDKGQNTPLATIADQTISDLPNGAVVIDGTTLTLSASPIIIAGTPISLNPTALVIDRTQLIPRPTLPPPPSPLIPFTTVAGEAVSRNADGAVVVKGKTLTPNGPGVTIAGTPVSIAISADRTFLIEGTRTIPLAASITAPFQLLGEMVSADEKGVFLVGGQTLVPGGEAIIVEGMRVSLGFGSKGVEVVVGGRTSMVLPASMASSINTMRGSRNGTVATGEVVKSASEPTGTAGVGGNGIVSMPVDVGSGASAGVRRLWGVGGWCVLVLWVV